LVRNFPEQTLQLNGMFREILCAGTWDLPKPTTAVAQTPATVAPICLAIAQIINDGIANEYLSNLTVLKMEHHSKLSQSEGR
jgi:hypothetical protein